MLLITSLLAIFILASATIYSAPILPFLVPDGENAIANINVNAPNQFVGNIEVYLAINHSYPVDLLISLRHNETRRTAVLYSNSTCTQAGFYGLFSDTASTFARSICSTSSPGGVFKPNEALSLFRGDPASGIWRVTISDVGDVLSQNFGFITNLYINITLVASGTNLNNPPTCAYGTRFPPQGTIVPLANVMINGTMCGFDDLSYFTVTAGGNVAFRLRYQSPNSWASNGDYKVSVFNNQFAIFSFSNSFTFHVNPTEWNATYSMRLEPVAPCTPDMYEPNNLMSQATSLVGDSVDNLRFCACNDWDWFTFVIGSPGGAFTYIITYNTGATQVLLTSFVFPNGTTLLDMDLTSAHYSIPPGTYYFGIQYTDRSTYNTDYTFDWEVDTITTGYVTTGVTTTTAIYSAATPFLIPDSEYTYTDIVVSAPNQYIAGMEIVFTMNHTYPSDLLIVLRHVETGKYVTLMNGNCDRLNAETNITFSDSAATSASSYGCQSGQFQGSFFPDDQLSSLNGLPATGTWRTTFLDFVTPDFGYVKQLSLIMTLTPILGGTISPTQTCIYGTHFPPGQNYAVGTSDIVISGTYCGFDDLTVFTLVPSGVAAVTATFTGNGFLNDATGITISSSTILNFDRPYKLHLHPNDPTFNFTVTFQPLNYTCVPDELEPNDLQSQASILSASIGSYSLRLCASNDMDWFRFTIATTGNITLNLTATNNAVLAIVSDTSEDFLVFSQSLQYTSPLLTAGDYYFGLRSESFNVSYTFSYQIDGLAIATTGTITTGSDLTTSPMTSGRVTSAQVTSAAATSSFITSGRMTSGSLTSGVAQASVTSNEITSGDSSSDIVTTESFGESSEDAGVVLYIPLALVLLILL